MGDLKHLRYFRGVGYKVFSELPPKKLSASQKRKLCVDGIKLVGIYILVAVIHLISVVIAFAVSMVAIGVFRIFEKEEIELGDGRKIALGLRLRPEYRHLCSISNLKKFLFIPKRYRS